jgi:hypothetical protein
VILTPGFSFLHLHKSGGTFVNEVLLGFVPGACKLAHHPPAALLPASHARLPVLGVVRNPWDYYVSWFAFQQERRTWVWDAFSEEGKLDFDATVRRMLCAGEQDLLIDRLVESVRGQRHGWYTFLFRRMYAELPVHFLHKENLREELLAFLRGQDLVTPQLEAHVRAAPPANVTRHGPYRGYYSPALARLLAERERPVVERFGYAF